MKNDIKIKIDIESVAKLTCINRNCVNNLSKSGYFACNLKYVTIGETGKCESMSKIKE